MQCSKNVATIQPRKLKFESPTYENCLNEFYNYSKGSKQPPIPLPYNKIRSLRIFFVFLRLFDTPATPKTIIKKSSGKCLNFLPESTTNSFTEKKKIFLKKSWHLDRPKAHPRYSIELENSVQRANINPFTPDNLLAHSKKRTRTLFSGENENKTINSNFKPIDYIEDDATEIQQAPKRLALQDSNISRYKKEFLEISLIGVGEFGLVYQCLNRLDGCIYAIKKSIKPVAGSFFEKRALNEVWAHAVLGKHDNVVRYYSAWAEDNHMLIQNEFCNGGSLHSLIQKRFLNEVELKILLLHVAEGLKYIHSNDLVHMDLKSGNIFLTKVASKCLQVNDSYEDCMEEIYEELKSAECIITYKIGDLGHVTSVQEAHVEEGDCRYLPNEILQENFFHLFKADIFSLGITLYEAAGGGPLPKNGPEWHQLRNGNIPDIPNLSRDFNDLIKLMTHPDPDKRPSSTTIFNHPILCSLAYKSKSLLSQELTIERRKNEILLKKLKESQALLEIYKQAENARTDSVQRSLTSERYLPSYVRTTRKSFRSKRD